MKNEILQYLNSVINSLDSVTVSGKKNFNNMAASINTLEEIRKYLSAIELVDPNSKHDTADTGAVDVAGMAEKSE